MAWTNGAKRAVVDDLGRPEAQDHRPPGLELNGEPSFCVWPLGEVPEAELT